MDTLLKYWMTILRDASTERSAFRMAAHQVTRIIAGKAAEYIPTNHVTIHTPIAQAEGITFAHQILLIPILRSGMAMLPAFLEIFPNAVVGIVGLKRDEKTAQAHWYYENVPLFDTHTHIIILDPMIATGGTALETLKFLCNKGAQQKNMIFASIVSAPEGISAIQNEFSDITIICAGHDKELNVHKFIIPGLGDFGDRYFGTE
jgi:uracil phosphoribosyltransferase